MKLNLIYINIVDKFATDGLNRKKHMHILILSQITNFKDFSKLKEFADDNFRFDENGGKFYGRVEDTVGKGEIARYERFLLFPQCFQNTCTVDTLKPGLFGKWLNSILVLLQWLLLHLSMLS